MLRTTRHIGIIFITALFGAATLGAAATPAGADPIDDKRAEAAALQSQIEAANEKISALGEQFNGAQLRLDQAVVSLAGVQAQIAAAEAEVARIKGLVNQRGASLYRRVLAGRSLDGFDVDDAQQLVTRKRYADAQAEQDQELLGKLADARAELATQRGAAERARAQAADERQQIEDTRASLEATTTQQEALLTKAQGELAALVQQEMERRQAEALALAKSKLGSGGDGDPNLPPPGPSAAKAIEWGKTQIGKTYVYAATGPDHYDCSGFTMVAFRNAGVALPHYSGAQYAMLPHVPLNAVQPGDLLVWGSGGSVHVAIYVGDARILESGGSGHDVHIGPIWGHPTGAARVLQ